MENMRFLKLVLCFVVLNVALALAACPPGEYNPGPNCGLEPSCSTRSSHAYPKHTCDCWCLPGTYRNLDTNACVDLKGC
uniref:SFRICE_018870 n=1 Tax=Spodoptera frugiperda TaxID=7108 RepID=A0A2H1V6Q7_SPOFR